jgi:amino acid transporter
VEHSPKHVKTLGRRDLTLFAVSAILLLDPMMSAAAIGASSIFWWVLLALLFFVPFGLVSAELGTTYPEQGGVYAWVRDAYGRRWGSRVTWAYWSNVAIWNPAMFILFAGVFSQLFAPDLPLGGQIAIGLALTWLSVWMNIVPLRIGKWVPNVGAICKIVIVLALMAGGVVHASRHGMANIIDVDTLLPSWGEGLRYVPAIVYGMLGFELMCAGSEEIRNPQRDLPWAIAISGLIIAGLYTFGTLGILIAIPVEDVNLVEGLMTTLFIFFGDSGPGYWFAVLLGIAALYTFFSSAVTWSLGTNRAMAEAASEGEFPVLLGREHDRHGTPYGAAIVNGVICTVALLLYGFMANTNEDLFWSLFAFSAVIFFLPYIMMMLAFIRLRETDRGRTRPFRFPGGRWPGTIAALFCAVVLCFSMALFVYVPERGIDWPVLIGAVVFFAVGEIIIRTMESGKRAAP